jgi:putative peptide zinc metalloprotease protein
MNAAGTTLRPLREDIDIHPAPAHKNGLPAWTLHDITTNRFFTIGRRELVILKFWHLGNPDDILNAINARFWPRITRQDVEEVATILAREQLLQASSARDTDYLMTLVNAKKRGLAVTLLHHYLSFRIPLLHPSAHLRRFLPLISWLFTPLFLTLSVLAGLAGLALVSLRWDDFTSFVPDMLSAQGIVWTLAAMIFAKTLHEFGHAFTATHFGCRVGTMGVAIILGYPMLYTDASEAWKLPRHNQRFLISLAGLGVEMILACWALLSWNLLESGRLRDICFLFAAVTWVVSLAVNASPFMRFDGYFLLMDWWGIPNLQPRAFALTKWKIRNILFGLNRPCPEQLPDRERNLMIVYAVATWIYRFFLFLGIAYLVYSFFFKMLGIFLMAVEVGWFIVLPIAREFQAWNKIRQEEKGVSMHKPLGLLLGLAILASITPLPGTVRIPALVLLRDEAHIYAPIGGRIEFFSGQPGDTVEAGQALAQLSNPELERAVDKARIRVQLLEQRLAAASVDDASTVNMSILREELRAARAALLERQKEQDKLTIRAPRECRIMIRDRTLQQGSVIHQGHELMVVGSTRNWMVSGLAGNEDFALLEKGMKGTFLPDNLGGGSMTCEIENLESYADRIVTWPLLADSHGGQIETTVETRASKLPLAQTPRHGIVASLPPDYAGKSQIRGVLLVRVWSPPIYEHVWKKMHNAWLREFGF